MIRSPKSSNYRHLRTRTKFRPSLIKVSFNVFSPEKLTWLFLLKEAKSSHKYKMIHLLTFDNLFPSPPNLGENPKYNYDGYHVFPPKWCCFLFWASFISIEKILVVRVLESKGQLFKQSLT